ncbi:MAG: B12-binding domain-containing radical SAM protein [Clostridia bacterium]|nr:B12-binding domain-containing radical SAM protein [Clostridia bacterium]MBR3592391.1 B12-binding domain-containing radical SAM protein [Clostridia bacterium]
MRILLINPKLPIFMRMPSLPLGLLSIASYLKTYGHEVNLVDTLVQNIDIEESLNQYKPDIVGISVMSFLAGIEAKRITQEIKKLKIPVVWGGQAATAMPELMIKEAEPDYIILGEGEVTWLELVTALENKEDVSKVAGLVYLENAKVTYTKTRELADISSFPDIHWNLVDVKKYFSSFFNCDKMVYLHASKGCPAQCTFCSNQLFHQSKNRCRDVNQIIKDIDYLYSQGVNGIYFSDELWIPNRKDRTELCKILSERKYNLFWGCQMRLGVLNEDDIELMYDAGCRWILFGIESGNKERIKLIKKNIDLDLAKPTVQMCEKRGITVQASFIIGYPDETTEEIKETLRFAESLGASLVVVNILTPLPNSEIYNQAKENGIFEYPNSIKEIAFNIEQSATDEIVVNLSKVNDLDLKVIHYYYQWKAFSNKDSVNNESFGIIKKAASDAINRIFKHGLKGFFYGTYSSVKQFSRVFFYSHAYGNIKKKYGLK